jgi:hypothetical protein
MYLAQRIMYLNFYMYITSAHEVVKQYQSTSEIIDKTRLAEF